MATENIMQTRKKKSDGIRRMVITAMLSAITALLTFTPLGMIPLPPPLPAVTLVHIPVILAVLVESLSVGLTVGLVFGLCSLIRAWETAQVGLTLFFRNPMVSVFPRLLIPLVAYLMYQLWKKYTPKNQVMDKLGVSVAAAVGAVTNTVCCLGMLLLIYETDLRQLLQGMAQAGNLDVAYTENVAAWLFSVVGLSNGIAEAIVAAVLIPVLKTAVEAVNRRTGRKPNSKKENRGESA